VPSQEVLTSWKAGDWDGLIQVWRDLVGEGTDHQPLFGEEEINPREAGYVFQTWIIEAFRLSGAEIEPPFRIPIRPGEDERAKHEIDGLFICEWNGFLIESKFQHVDFGPVARLHVLTEGCPIGTMGLFFAAKGFTSPAIDAVQYLRPMRVLLFDQVDIESVLQHENRDFIQAVRLKWKAAIMLGMPNTPITALWNEGTGK
jgi:hypothetical protein